MASREATVLRQIAMVLDLNKCIGCQTCTIACKKLWNTDTGSDYAYWNNVETLPGAGYPRNWTDNGGRTGTGEVKAGRVPNLDEEYGRAWKFNHEEVRKRAGKPWLRRDKAPHWGANWKEDGPIWKLVHRFRVALPLHPEFGLEPNVFYVPPMSPPKLDAKGRPTREPRVPTGYLEGLFGDGLREALATLEGERAKRRRGECSELMELLIAYDWNENFALAERTPEVI